ncbi:hypothetical protein MVEN_00755200 [Mycena venus]|uniref:Uncharacterized protein n=1 Tax=Mycena venus TaxID=2733690 RepID=A0A8H6YL48_9AGAR|nr:hypothetical protein MVEN_00755200 [Mycena venus]
MSTSLCLSFLPPQKALNLALFDATPRWPSVAHYYTHLLLPSLFYALFYAHIHKPSARHNALGFEKRDTLTDSGLTSASWIWTAEPTTGNVAFLRTFNSAAGKTAHSATISLTAVNQATVWVNGNPVGATGNDWQSAEGFSARLNASTNTFSVLAVNANPSAPAPGFLAAIKVKYADGSGETIVSDGSWSVSAVIPTDFPTPADASHFLPATVAGAFGSGSWGSSLTVSSPPSTSAILSESTWIWSTATAATNAAAGSIGLRKTVASPSGKIAQSATVLMAADNGFQLYVNGEYIGQSPGVPTIPDFLTAMQFAVNLDSASNVFSVIASNEAGPAGLAATITIQYSDGSTSVVATDATWLTGPSTSVPQFLAAADSTLSKTFAVGKMGAQPWGAMSMIANALAAPKVPSGPFASGTVPPSSAGHPSTNPSGPSSTGPSSTGPTSASTPGIGGGLASSPSETGNSAPNSTSNPVGDSSPNTDTNSNTNASSSHSISTTLIVAIIVAVLALIGIFALFFWRRRRNNSTRHSRAMSRDLFDAANGVGRSGGGSSVAASQRTSIASAAHAEMIMVQPQQPSYTYNYPRPPIMVQGVYVQPPPAGQSYPQPPLPAVLGHSGNPTRLVVVGEPPLSPISPMQQQMAAQQMAAQQMAAQRMASQQAAAQQMATPQTTAVPSKLERELIWRNNAAASNPSSTRSSTELSYASGSAAGPSGLQTHGRGPSDDYDADALAPPPSYSAQSPLHMQ